jgi:phosphatidylserine/phosphatidylglycerophosphate/cardiolipin synthase-like enzyme
VLVSSQNWSGAGTTANRDAGVIISNPKVASYFQTIYLHDWNNLPPRGPATTNRRDGSTRNLARASQARLWRWSSARLALAWVQVSRPARQFCDRTDGVAGEQTGRRGLSTVGLAA